MTCFRPEGILCDEDEVHDNDEAFSDVFFVLKNSNERVHVNRALLSTQSVFYFQERMLRSEMTKIRTNEMETRDEAESLGIADASKDICMDYPV